MNYCDSGLHAVDHANTRGGDAYSASGVGACQCRHMMVRKLGVGDLQKGERYIDSVVHTLGDVLTKLSDMQTWTMSSGPLSEDIMAKKLPSHTTSYASGIEIF